jgi:carbamoyltransferase
MNKPCSGGNRSYILGVSASHNGGACLIRGDEIIVAIQEERLTRVKRKRVLASEPSLAIQYCLDSANIEISDLDMIVVCVQGNTQDPRQNASLNPQFEHRRNSAPIVYAPHHLCHAISAYATSGFSDSDILVIDGIGSPQSDLTVEERKLTANDKKLWEGLSYYRIDGEQIEPLIKHMSRSLDFNKKIKVNDSKFYEQSTKPLIPTVHRPQPSKQTQLTSLSITSLGSMFEAVSLIIFGERLQAGKVMGLAAYGNPTISIEEFLNWENGVITYTDAFESRFKQHKFWPMHTSCFQDLACSVQHALEYAVLKQIEFLRHRTNGKNLCYAGGVALNTLLNERIIRESGYDKVHIIPAAEDSGTAIGAAYYGLQKLSNTYHTKPILTDSLGHDYSNGNMAKSLPGVEYYEGSLIEALDKVVDLLCAGNIGAWFQGGAELGPRALGQRSMICDPRTQNAKDNLNHKVKKREAFRPFAPIVLAEHAQDWFDFGDSDPQSPFMLRVAQVRPHVKDLIPAVVHVDGSARVQTVTKENGLLYVLLQHFYVATGVPILLNTSLNVAGEPIVETPKDAWRCLYTTPLSFGMIDQQLIIKNNNSQSLLDFIPNKIINHFIINKESANPHSAGSVSVFADTPWGELKSTISIHHLYILNAIDGKRSGVDIMRGFKQDPLDKQNKETMLDTLRTLHQFHAINFNE